MSGEDTLHLLAAELAQALVPLDDAVASPQRFAALLREMGWDFTGPVPPPVAALAAGIADLRAALDLALGGTPSPQELEDLGAAIRDLVGAVRELANLPPGSFPADLEAAGFIDEFPARLVQLLVVTHLQHNHPRLETLLRVLGIVRVELVPAAGDRPAHVTRLLALPDLADLLRDPGLVLKRVYGWGTADFRYQDVFEHVADLTASFGLDVYLDELDPRQVVALEAGAVVPSRPVRWSLKAPLLLGAVDGASVEAGVGLFALPAQGAHLPGLSLLPYAEGELQERVQLSERVSLVIEADADLTAGVGVVLRPDEPIDLLTELVPSADAGVAPPSGGRVRVRLEVGEAGGGPTVLLGAGGVGRVEVSRSSLTGKAEVDSTGGRQLGVELELQGAALVIAPDEADSFVRSILPADGLQAKFDLGLAWSNERGLTFRGAAGLDATLPVGISIGGVITISAIHLGLQATGAALVAEVSASVGLSIGPVQALVDHLGITSALSFPDDGGNLGIADVALAFKPPSGVALVIDSAGVSGGGFLKFDEPNHQYAGVLQLQFTDLALEAFGIITTQVEGTAGYSLLALIDANFPPVALGWGFTLNGVGGLRAVNRAASVDALRAAVKADKLSAVLFPKNAITNAPQILAELDSLFPTAHGRFLFGPMALIGWGTPTVLTAAIAVIIELPEPIRILLLARLAVRAPTESNALVRINMDALGVLDLSKNELSLDAVLFDSRLVTYTLSGSMALRATWAAQREFLLAIGGFHPRFTPPPGFPALQRITIDMPGGIVSKLRLAAYLAITSNTVQLGADLDVFIGVSGFGLSGHLGFDALLQFAPFHFEADISGKVALTAGGDDLMSVDLDATVSGPAPWHIAGSFKIHIVFFDVHKSFSHSWGEEAPAVAATTVDVLQLLQATLADPRSWDAQMPGGIAALTPLRQIQDAASVLAHPLALPEVHERIVPLDLAITRFGEAAPAGASRFDITDWRLGGTAPPRATIDDDFAAAQFFDLSDEEKLARPSFERHTAGVQMDAGLVTSGPAATKTILFETSFIDEPGGQPRHDPGVPVTPPVFGDLVVILETGSAGRSGISRAGYRKYNSPGNPIRVAEPRFAVVDGDSLASAGVGPSGGSPYSDAAALLAGAISSAPARRGALGIVATHEMAT